MPSASAPPEPGPPLVLSLVELQGRIEGCVTEFLEGKSPETIGTYRRTLNEFERWFITKTTLEFESIWLILSLS